MLMDDVKENLRITDSEFDGTIERCIAAAVDYAESYQNKDEGFYKTNEMRDATRQAVVLLASHFFETTDGSTGGFMADSPAAAQQTAVAVDRLLSMDKRWDF